MSLTDEQKQFYIDTIETIWQGSMQENNVEHISDAVAQDVDTVLYAIKLCSNNFKNFNPSYAPIYEIEYPANWVEYVLSFNPPLNIPAWINLLRANRLYRACVNSPAATWKSIIQGKILEIGQI